MNLKHITAKDFFDTLSAPARNVTFWRRVVLHLSLLRHAAKCKHEHHQDFHDADQQQEEGARTTSPLSSSSCCMVPRCRETKELWKHVSACKDSRCNYPLCTSSRLVLTHHYRCNKDPSRVGCPCRGPLSRQFCQPVHRSSTETSVESVTEAQSGI